MKVILILIIMFFSSGCSDNDGDISTDIKFTRDTLYFPKMSQGDTAKAIYHFTSLVNDLKILDVSASCGCTKPVYDSIKIYNIGDTGHISIGYNSSNDSGNVIKNVVVKTNASSKLHILYMYFPVRP